VAAIVAAAETCFARYGISRTRVEDIAAEVGIPRPHVYRHFASKDAIVHAVIVHQIQRHHARLAERFPLTGPASEIVLGSLLSGIHDAAPDVEALTSGDAAQITAQSLANSPEILALIESHWKPVLEYARDRGELHDHIQIPDAIRWLVQLELSYLALPQLTPSDTQLETDLRTFVLPALFVPIRTSA